MSALFRILHLACCKNANIDVIRLILIFYLHCSLPFELSSSLLQHWWVYYDAVKMQNTLSLHQSKLILFSSVGLLNHEHTILKQKKMCQPYKKIIKSPLELRFPSSNKKRTQKETQSSCLVEKSQVHFLKTWSPKRGNVELSSMLQTFFVRKYGSEDFH